MKLLVTGGAGYVGSVCAAHLVDAGHDVTVLDDLSTGHADAVPDGAEFVKGDVGEAADDLLADGVDGVLHFAARSLVGESVQRPELYWQGNVVDPVANERPLAVRDSSKGHVVWLSEGCDNCRPRVAEHDAPRSFERGGSAKFSDQKDEKQKGAGNDPSPAFAFRGFVVHPADNLPAGCITTKIRPP